MTPVSPSREMGQSFLNDSRKHGEWEENWRTSKDLVVRVRPVAGPLLHAGWDATEGVLVCSCSGLAGTSVR